MMSKDKEARGEQIGQTQNLSEVVYIRAALRCRPNY